MTDGACTFTVHDSAIVLPFFTCTSGEPLMCAVAADTEESHRGTKRARRIPWWKRERRKKRKLHVVNINRKRFVGVLWVLWSGVNMSCKSTKKISASQSYRMLVVTSLNIPNNAIKVHRFFTVFRICNRNIDHVNVNTQFNSTEQQGVKNDQTPNTIPRPVSVGNIIYEYLTALIPPPSPW